MMNTVNGISFDVVLVDSDDDRLVFEGTSRGATIHKINGKIYIDKNMPFDIMRRAIAHELTHAYIFACGFLSHGKYSEEELCEFMSVYCRDISIDTSRLLTAAEHQLGREDI